MGFPTWTLVGMGVTFSFALLLVILAYLAQSPGSAARLGLGNARLDGHVKTFTGYALALMLLCLGFFIAGVPLDAALTATAVPTPTLLANAPAENETNLLPTNTITPTATITSTETLTTSADNFTPASGAFGGPPPEEEEPEALTETGEPSLTPQPTNTATPVNFTPTATATASPTSTPTPTVTPTPIDGQTAVLDLEGGVVWLYRSPGGQTLVVLQDQEVVILGNGRANRAGIIWREVSTGDGSIGWVEERFLKYEEE